MRRELMQLLKRMQEMLAEEDAEAKHKPMRMYLDNLRTKEEMERAQDEGWTGGASCFSGYFNSVKLGRWCEALANAGMRGRVSLNKDCFEDGDLSPEGTTKCGMLAMFRHLLDGVEIEDASPHYEDRVRAVEDAIGEKIVFNYQKLYGDHYALSKLWYPRYGQASEVGKVDGVKAWRDDPFAYEPLRSFSVWPVERMDRPDGKTPCGHVWLELMGDELTEPMVQRTRWQEGNRDRYAIPPRRGHIFNYLWQCHRMNISQVSFFSGVRHQSWGDKLIWEANPKLWEDLISAVDAYNAGPLALPDTWSQDYKDSNVWVTPIRKDAI